MGFISVQIESCTGLRLRQRLAQGHSEVEVRVEFQVFTVLR